MSENRGEEAEDLVEVICHKAFLADFTVRGPKFTKAGGTEKEAADFLVPFGRTLIAFQVKSKTETKPVTEKSETDFGRIQRKIKVGISQLKTIKRALKNGQLTEVSNGANVKLPFMGDATTDLVGVVIVELFGEERFGDDERTAIYNGYSFENQIPTHIFTRQIFETISSELDTIPDFLEYLRTREAFYKREILSSFTHELDFLALYKTQPAIIRDCLNGKCDLLVIDGDLWSSYRQDHVDRIARRDAANNPSYLIDRVIQWLHTSIGFESRAFDPTVGSTATTGTVETYAACGIALSSTTRLERRMIGATLLDALRRADDVGYGHAIVRIGDETGVLVLSTARQRPERARGLINLASMAYCGLSLKKVIGIATEPLTVTPRSYDVILMQNVEFENSDELKQEFRESFGESKHARFNEYSGKRKVK